MLLYAATYPRCGSGVLRQLLAGNFAIGTDSYWDANPGDRPALAAAAELRSVKTHAPPPVDPLPGEVAIQLIRHPGPTIASHYNLHLRTNGVERPLKRFIAGQRKTGDWTSYHRAWAATAMPVLRLRYEDVTADPASAVHRMAEFLGLPAPAEVAFESLEAAHLRNPARNPAAAPDAWRQLIQGKDLQRLREAHGGLAAEWGYSLD
jgi:LPS sulfotransferase NodH